MAANLGNIAQTDGKIGLAIVNDKHFSWSVSEFGHKNNMDQLVYIFGINHNWFNSSRNTFQNEKEEN